MNYFIFKGISTIDFDIIVNTFPDIESSEEEGEFISIPGRDGFLFQSNNRYTELDKPITITLKNVDNINNIKSWLTGDGDLILSNEIGIIYKARITGKITFQRSKSVWVAQINFKTQPFGYFIKEDVTITESTELNNPGNHSSNPIMTVYGVGDITLNINSKNIILSGITDYITLNSEIEEAYRDLVNMNNYMIGEFPIFDVGINAILWIGTVSKIDITPNWRNK